MRTGTAMILMPYLKIDPPDEDVWEYPYDDEDDEEEGDEDE